MQCLSFTYSHSVALRFWFPGKSCRHIRQEVSSQTTKSSTENMRNVHRSSLFPAMFLNTRSLVSVGSDQWFRDQIFFALYSVNCNSEKGIEQYDCYLLFTHMDLFEGLECFKFSIKPSSNLLLWFMLQVPWVITGFVYAPLQGQGYSLIWSNQGAHILIRWLKVSAYQGFR